MAEIVNADPAPELFKQFRAKHGMTQKQAAELFGVSRATWDNWETNSRPQVAARLLVALMIAKPELMDLLLEQDAAIAR